MIRKLDVLVVLLSTDAIYNVTEASEHVVNKRRKKVEPKKTKARQKKKKIVVGGLNTEISDDEIKIK